MFSGDQNKPWGAPFNKGPNTEPQARLLYHGLGTPHSLAYTSNPVSWLVGAMHCIPFLNLLTGNKDTPVDSAVLDQLEVSSDTSPFSDLYNLGDQGVLPDTSVAGGTFQNGYGMMEEFPQSLPQTIAPPSITGFSAAGVPVGTLNSPNPIGGQIVGQKQIAFWGSRKTLGMGGK